MSVARARRRCSPADWIGASASHSRHVPGRGSLVKRAGCQVLSAVARDLDLRDGARTGPGDTGHARGPAAFTRSPSSGAVMSDLTRIRSTALPSAYRYPRAMK